MKYKLTELQLAGNKQVKDAKALLDLLNEYCQTDIKMSFTRANRGRAKLAGNFTVPVHAINKNNETYLFYYVVHEFTHCLGNHTHDASFKSKERELLNLFNISIDYAKAYPRTLYANGQQAYYQQPRKRLILEHKHIYSIMKVVNGKQKFYCHYCHRVKPD